MASLRRVPLLAGAEMAAQFGGLWRKRFTEETIL